MNRLGVTIEEAAAISPRLSSENHGMTLLISHLISAATPDNARNHDQLVGFREIRRLFRGIRLRSIRRASFSAVRPCATSCVRSWLCSASSDAGQDI